MTTQKNLDNYSLIHHITLVASIVAAVFGGFVLALITRTSAEATLRTNAALCSVANDVLRESNEGQRTELQQLKEQVRQQQELIDVLQTRDELDQTFEHSSNANSSSGLIGFSYRR